MVMASTFALPIVFIILIITMARARRRLAALAPLAVIPGLVLAMLVDARVLEVPWMLFGVHLARDDLARPLVLVGSLLYGAALMSVSWLKVRDADSGYSGVSAFLLAAYVGNMGVFLAQDTWTFYFSFTVMSFSAVGLIVHYRTESAHRATGLYIVMTVISETSVLAAIILITASGGGMLIDAPSAVAASPYSAVIVALLLAGFGIKAGTVPLHVWLPLAHPAAPPAASAVLSGVMVKAGMVGWLRFLPLGQETETMGWILLILSLAGALLAAVLGVVQTDPKVILAYSTISQMGFIGVLVAVGVIYPHLAPETAAAAVLYAVHHSLAKGALFLGVPVVKHYGGGAGRWLVLIGMVGAGFAVAGAPLTSGGFGKYVSKNAVEEISVLGIGLDALLPFVATGSTVLLIRFALVLWKGERSTRRTIDGELISWLMVCIAGIVVPWWIGARWSPLGVPTWDGYTVWTALWPILLGLILGFGVWRLGTTESWMPRIPPGDLVVLEERGWVDLVDRGHRWGRRVKSAAQNASPERRLATRTSATLTRVVERTEERLGRWENSGTVIVVLVTLAVCVPVIIMGVI